MRSYILNPAHPSGEFRRTIRIEGREPRFVLFTVGGSVELDPAEAKYMAKEIERGIIGLAGCEFAKPAKPEAPRLSVFDEPRDEDFNLVPDRDLTNWQRFT